MKDLSSTRARDRAHELELQGDQTLPLELFDPNEPPPGEANQLTEHLVAEK